jgi:hypothetical protein
MQDVISRLMDPTVPPIHRSVKLKSSRRARQNLRIAQHHLASDGGKLRPNIPGKDGVSVNVLRIRLCVSKTPFCVLSDAKPHSAFDVLILKAERLDARLGTLSRLKSWLEILTKVVENRETGLMGAR